MPGPESSPQLLELFGVALGFVGVRRGIPVRSSVDERHHPEFGASLGANQAVHSDPGDDLVA
jgi:hypothetical protein